MTDCGVWVFEEIGVCDRPCYICTQLCYCALFGRGKSRDRVLSTYAPLGIQSLAAKAGEERRFGGDRDEGAGWGQGIAGRGQRTGLDWTGLDWTGLDWGRGGAQRKEKKGEKKALLSSPRPG